jgi:hypothetical protein
VIEIMTQGKSGSWDGKERRSGTDRRKTDRRDPERNTGAGVLTTRSAERRQKDRRKGEPKKDRG